MIRPFSARPWRWLAGALALISLAAGAQAPDRSQHRFRSQPIAGQYIVVFNDSVSDPDDESVRSLRRHGGGARHHLYRNALKGFSASLSDAAVQKLRNDPNVAFIEQDQTVTIDQVQNQATWGIDRIDQVDRPLDTVYRYNYTGAGVNAFIIDTGMRLDHTQFTGRVLTGFSSITDGRGTNDCNGHGTHVAGTVGGSTWGVARGVSLIPVRVLDCNGSGSWSGVIAGIDYVANSTRRPAVANLSLGGGFSASVNAAVANAVAKGVTMVVAAGNDNANACNSSPASEPTAITVGATTNLDARASYSNWGTCVDIFAPGSSITSSWYTTATATNTISGTSMATPHVTGVAALTLQANPAASPAAVAAFIVAKATPNRVSSAGTGTPNLLLYSLGTGAAIEPVKAQIAVRSLSAITGMSTSMWNTQVTITIRNVVTNANVANATVTGSFSPGNTVSCVTGSAGSCAVTSSTYSRNSVLATVYTVTNVTAPNAAYQSSQNSITQLRVNRP